MKFKHLVSAFLFISTVMSVNAQDTSVSTLKVSGKSTFNGYVTVNKGATLKGTTKIYPGGSNHFEFFKNTSDNLPTFCVYTSAGAAAPMRFLASQYDFTGDADLNFSGYGWFNKGISVMERSSFQNGLQIFCGAGPLNISFTSENLTPEIAFMGRYGTSSGIFKASSFSFKGGSVGIGVDVDSIQSGVKLQVNGKILCTGDIEVSAIDARDINTNEIKTKDIQVQMNDVADYVFESDYNLMQLSEVESYVKENKHLPGVPSASEIEANGVSLPAMTNLLLEKVEELTLHMIQLEKENKALKAKVESLEK